jgi:PAS domain S-box-containing protein
MEANSEALYRALFEASRDGIVILDDEGRCIQVNDSLCRLLKAPRESLVGAPFREFIPPERQESTSADFRRCFDGELPLQATDGSLVELEWTAGAGFVPGLHFCIARDITDRKAAERELARKQQELEDFVENATVGLHWVGPDGTILWANRAELELLGYAREEYIGHNIAEFHIDAPVIADILQRLTRKEELHSYEARLRCKDGSLRHVLISSNVFWDGDRFVHTRCFTRDITARRLAEEEAERQRQWLKTTLSSIGDAVIVTDQSGAITFTNEVAEGLTGWAQDQAQSRLLPEVFQIVNEVTRQPVPNPVEKVFETGHIVGLANHTVLIARDGSEYAIDDSAAPIRNDAGELLGVVLIFRDISERRRLEIDARRLAAIVASSDDAIVSKDLNGIVTSWNQAAERIFGYSAEEMVGKPIAILVPPERPDEEPAILARIRKGERIDHYETVRVRKDGTRLDVSVTISPIRDEEGHIIGASKVARDITAQKQALIVASRLAAIVESSDDAIIGKDLNGIVTSWNQAAERIYGYSAEEMVGKPIAILVPPDRPDEEPAILERIRRGERIDHYETVRMRKDGTRLDVSVTISPVRDAAGQIVGASKVARDITQEKALRDELQRRVEELAEAGRRKDQFLAMLAHELRNPLGAISNAVHVLQQSQGSETTRQRATQVLRRQVQHQARIVNDLLDVSRITRGLIELRPEALDLGRLVRETAEDYRVAFEQERIALQLELPESPLWVKADPTRLAQVVSNLLSNALKFTPAGGRVTVRAQPGDDASQGLLTVTDTGIGIEPELLPHIFDSLSQGDRTLARSRGGLGLGLAIVKGLVELHGGTVRAESEGQGQGTTVQVELPLLPAVASEGLQAKGGSRTEGRALRVLVVEDHQDAAEMLKDLLEMNGYDVQIALTGPEGVRVAHEYHPDVILCDLGLPGMDGYEVAEALRMASGGVRQRLVAVTGYGQDEDRRRSREAGFQYHLVKPIDPEELREVLLLLAEEQAGLAKSCWPPYPSTVRRRKRR